VIIIPPYYSLSGILCNGKAQIIDTADSGKSQLYRSRLCMWYTILHAQYPKVAALYGRWWRSAYSNSSLTSSRLHSQAREGYL